MKKLLLIGLAVGSLLSSCSNDDVIDVNTTMQGAIGFDGAFVNKSARGTETKDYALNALKTNGFLVWGGVKMPGNEGSAGLFGSDGQLVSFADNQWSYSPLRYWQTGAAYVFTAVGPANSSAWSLAYPVTPPADFSNERRGTISFNNDRGAGLVDLVYAFDNTVKNAAANQATVNLTFGHLLSQVKVTFRNTFANTGSGLAITNVKISSPGNGTFTLDGVQATTAVKDVAWTIGDGVTTFALAVPDGTTFNTGEERTTDSKVIIPNADKITVAFDVQLFSGTQAGNKWSHSVDVDLTDSKMLPGYSYNLVAEINASNVSSEGALNPILFSVQGVEDWIDGGEVNLKVPVHVTIGQSVVLLPGETTTATGVTWKSSDEAVATVDAGTVTGVAAGKCTITADYTVDGKAVTDTWYVTVEAEQQP